MDLNASPIMKGNNEKKKVPEFERAYFRDWDLRNIRNLSSISSINSTPLRELDQMSSRPLSAVSSEVLAYSSNLRNVLRYANNSLDKLHGSMCTSSEKNGETNGLRKSNFESIIMPPPSTSRVQRRKTLTNEISYSPSIDKHRQIDNHQLSKSDIFRTMEQQQSVHEVDNHNTRVFKQWTIMISRDGKLLVKGKLGEGVIARSKPICRKLSCLKLESIYKHLYKLEGNLVDKKNELPPYVRSKFINGFPDDWQNVVVIWKQYLTDKHKSNFRWPTPASDSDHDDTPESSNIEHDGSIRIYSPDQVSVNTSQPASVAERVKPNSIEVQCVRPNSSIGSLRCPTNGVVELLGKEKLVAFTKTLAKNNVSPEFVNKFCELMVCMNSLVTMEDYQNMLTDLSSDKTNVAWENSVSILDDSVMSTPKKMQPPMEKVEERMKKDKEILLSDDEDNDRCAGVPKIPSNIFQNRKTVHRHPRRSRQEKRKFEHEVNNCDYPDDVSILTEYKDVMVKNRLANKNQKYDNSVEKDSGCHMMSGRVKKRRCTDDYDDAASDIFDLKIPRYKENAQPSILSIENVSVDLNALQNFGGKSPVKNVVARKENPEEKSPVKNAAARKENPEEKSPLKNVAARRQNPEGKSPVKNVAARKEIPERKNPVKNVAARADENKENEKVNERKSYCLRSETTERRSYGLKSEEKEKMDKENKAAEKKRESDMIKENKEADIEKGQYGSVDHPKLLKCWKVDLVYDQKLTNQCGLVLVGTLKNEAGYVHCRKFQTDPIKRRISPTLVETIKNEYFELKDVATNKKHVPKPLHSHLKNGLPSNLDEFCNKWKTIEDKNKSCNLDSTGDLDSTLKRQRRQAAKSNYWMAADNKGVQKSPPSTDTIAKKLFPEKDEKPPHSKTIQNTKKTKEIKKAVPENPEPKNQGEIKKNPKCTYDAVYKGRNCDVVLSDDYFSER